MSLFHITIRALGMPTHLGDENGRSTRGAWVGVILFVGAAAGAHVYLAAQHPSPHQDAEVVGISPQDPSELFDRACRQLADADDRLSGRPLPGPMTSRCGICHGGQPGQSFKSWRRHFAAPRVQTKATLRRICHKRLRLIGGEPVIEGVLPSGDGPGGEAEFESEPFKFWSLRLPHIAFPDLQNSHGIAMAQRYPRWRSS
jgi:hypothetical protein